jgi:short-subunit dehydrogenase
LQLEDPAESPILATMHHANPGTDRTTRQTVIVTGASSGIGEATARRFARHGFDVALIARRGDLLEGISKEIEREGARAFPIIADLADENATQRAVDRAAKALGRVDVLVNNAGYSPGAAIEQFTRSEIRHIFEVNLFSTLQLIGAVTPIMREQGGGRIVNIGSVAGIIPAPLAIPYAATKAGMHAASDALRMELMAFGIQLALVIPGFVDTAVFDNARESSRALREDPTNPYRQMMFDLDDLAQQNLRNPISPADVAEVVLRAATARKPKRRYYTPFSTRLQCAFLTLLPDSIAEALLTRVYKLGKT